MSVIRGFFTERGNGKSSYEEMIQNIILQEMEDLTGLLIATTNMTQNLDKAFERRFLYKILFEKPSQEAMIHIWKSKIPKLPRKQAIILAKQYQLSGGQIDNVARKCLMHQLLHGNMPSIDGIMAMCAEEIMEKQHFSRIGFQYQNQ
ncbi:MAG: AAA family ATPase, partial [Bacteroidia bacterium]|nr:AAA family ATPase [Bacteroidia bacterium]